MFASLLLLLGSISLSSAITLTGGNCTDFNVAITATANNLNANGRGTTAVTGTFNLACTFCQPTTIDPLRANTIVVLHHGETFTRTYWDVPLTPASITPTTNSFVQSGTTFGWQILLCDKLGAGRSQRPPNAQATTQIPLDASIVTQIVTRLRLGSLTPIVPLMKNILQVGHSLGSAILSTHMLQAPLLTDAVVLTGYSHVPKGAGTAAGIPAQVGPTFQAAATNNRQRFNGLDPNYVTTTNLNSRRTAFYGPVDSFDPVLLNRDDTTKDVVSNAELTAIAGTIGNQTAYRGAVMIIAGQFDPLYCASIDDCGLDEDTFYPNAFSVNTFVLQNASRALTYHQLASVSFQATNQFFSAQGF